MQNSIQRLFWAGNQGNHQNLKKNDTSFETQGCFHFFFEKNIKISFSSSANSHYFFAKISWIGPLVIVGLIDAKGIDVAQPREAVQRM